jgi:hypothetical protein
VSLIADLPRVAEWVARQCEADPRSASAAIGWLRDDDLTAGVFYEDFTGASITATIAMAPGAVMPKDFLWTIFDYPFNQLGVEKMVALVAENNWKSKNLVEKMGFTEEARIGCYYPAGEAMIIYTLSKGLCRFLEKDNGQEG